MEKARKSPRAQGLGLAPAQRIWDCERVGTNAAGGGRASPRALKWILCAE
jgi:hypothetical protein